MDSRTPGLEFLGDEPALSEAEGSLCWWVLG
jgi:hypothetical protein